MNKLTPVLLVEAIEPSLTFWADRLGFERVVEVPEAGPDAPAGSPIGFVILQRGGVEVMLQSRGSVAADIPALATGPFAKDGVSLFIEVDDLDPIVGLLEGADIVVPERTTFYGMREIGVRTPEGATVVFAQRVGEQG